MPSDAPTPTDFSALHRRLDQTERLLRTETTHSPEARARTLEARASALAIARTLKKEETLEVFAFQVGGERYAARLAEVEEVLEAGTLAHLPGAPRFVLGALNVSGLIVVVLDLRQLLHLGGMSDLVRVVVLRGATGPFGIAVETVDGRLELPLSACTPATDGPFSFITADRLAVLDLARLEDSGA